MVSHGTKHLKESIGICDPILLHEILMPWEFIALDRSLDMALARVVGLRCLAQAFSSGDGVGLSLALHCLARGDASRVKPWLQRLAARQESCVDQFFVCHL